MRKHYDVAIFTPLEEEFDRVVSEFEFQENLTKGDDICVSVAIADVPLSIIVVRPRDMGKTAMLLAVQTIATEYDIGLAVCVGIAGAISSDLNIGDVVCSEIIGDVLDNVKVSDEGSALSPEYSSVDRRLLNVVMLYRLLPSSRDLFAAWQEKQYETAARLLPDSFRGKDGKREQIEIPIVRSGLIVCGPVVASPKFKAKLQDMHRRVLAIETESGGLFAAAIHANIPAFTIRGISDYAAEDKKAFEKDTKGKGRVIASANAATFLTSLLRDPQFHGWVAARRTASEVAVPLPGLAPPPSKLSSTLEKLADDIDAKLRDLSPAFSLQGKGYRLPVPRIRPIDPISSPTQESWQDPIDLRPALRSSRVILLHVPKEYPDRSLSWVVAGDLLTADIDGRQIIPIVVEASHLQRPSRGVREIAPPHAVAFDGADFCKLLFIVDNFQFNSPTKTAFLIQQIESLPDAHFIVVTRDRGHAWHQSEFSGRTAAAITRVSDISFIEISHFLQKNFELASQEAQVVATRLCETFSSFDLPPHPTFFQAIPKDTLASLLQANRRGELLQLAIAGYLSFVVAEDDQPIPLNRTTREQFLSELAYELRVQKRAFTPADLAKYVEELGKRFDFNISPTRFVELFIEKGLLRVDDGKIQFTLPFMESYLLAKKLQADKDAALAYFRFGNNDFDYSTFTLYAELGAPLEFIDRVFTRMDQMASQLAADNAGDKKHILLTDEVNPTLFARQDRVQRLQKKLGNAVADVRRDRDESSDKQRLLDATARIREEATKRSAKKNEEEASEKRGRGDDTFEIWVVAVALLGAGAERIEGEVKRKLIRHTISLLTLILEDWTKFQNSIDFDELKSEMQKDEDLIRMLAKSPSDEDLEQARSEIGSLVELLQFLFLAEPFMTMTSILCEEAHEKVLAESLRHTTPQAEPERLFHSLWLADIDVASGQNKLIESIKALPRAKFLRVLLATHLMMRVFWKQSRKDDRLALLDAAEEALKVVGSPINKGEVIRKINSGDET